MKSHALTRTIVQTALPALVLLFLLTGCSPSLSPEPARNLTEGQIKTLAADVITTLCTDSVTAYIRNPLEPTTWSRTGPAVVSGQTGSAVIYTSDIPGSDQLAAGTTRDFKWVVNYRTYFPPIVNWFIGPCGGAGSIEKTGSFTVTARPTATLSLSPVPLAVMQGSSANLTVAVTRGGGFAGTVTVTFTGAPASVTFNPASLAVAGASGVAAVSASSTAAPGSYTVTATGRDAAGTVMDQKTFSLTIASRPTISLTLSPDPLNVVQGGSANLTVGVTRGGGLTGPVTVTFSGNPGAVTFNPSSLAISGASGVAAVSASSTAAPGSSTVTARGLSSAGTVSAQKTFALNVNAPSPALIFRSSNINVQSFSFLNPLNPVLIDIKPATTSTGGMTPVVGLAYNSSGHLVRASALDAQSFSATPAGSLAPVSTVTASTAVTGVAVWTGGTTVLRASELVIQAFVLASGSLQPRGVLPAYTSLTGVGVDAYGAVAVRGHNAGIEVFDISNLSALSRLGNFTAGFTSTTGVDVKMFASGSRAVRAHNMGIEIYALSPLSLSSSATGSTSTTGVAVDVDASGTRAVRAYNMGIEVYDISNPANISRMGSRTGSTSVTGVDVYVRGNYAYRTTDMRIEAYDISNPSSIQLVSSITATTSTTGVAITGQ